MPPLLGGMERLNWHMAHELARAAEVRIVGPQGAAVLSPPKVVVREAPLRPLVIFLLIALWRGLREALRFRPDIVLAGSGLTAPIAWLVARCCKARMVVYVHGLDIVVPSPIYRRLWLPAIRRADRVIANSHATAKLAEQIGISTDCLGVVHPGVDLPQLEIDSASATRFRLKYDLTGRPVLISVGRLTQRKGLLEFVTNVLPEVVHRKPDVVLLIVGDEARQALHSKFQTRETIQAAADAAGVGRHLCFLGKLRDSELIAAYQASDVHVFPIQYVYGDPEGFGMVAVEAAAHGLPTVAYACGGVVDAVRHDVSGWLVEPEDASGFAAAVLRELSSRRARSQIYNFATGFTWTAFGDRIRAQLVEASQVNTA